MSYAVIIFSLAILSLAIIVIALLVGMSLAFVVLDQVVGKMVTDDGSRAATTAPQLPAAKTSAAPVTAAPPIMQTAQ